MGKQGRFLISDSTEIVQNKAHAVPKRFCSTQKFSRMSTVSGKPDSGMTRGLACSHICTRLRRAPCWRVSQPGAGGQRLVPRGRGGADAAPPPGARLSAPRPQPRVLSQLRRVTAQWVWALVSMEITAAPASNRVTRFC